MQDNHFALTRVRLRHYRSIATADGALGPLLLLVGPNGSGKSNFLDALRLVSESLQTSLDGALRTRGGIGEVRRRSTGHPTHLSIDLAYRGTSFEGEYGFVIDAVKGGGFRISREECVVRRDEGAGTAMFRVADGTVVETSESVMPPASDQRLTLVAAAGLDSFRPVFDGLTGISVFSLNPDAMRQPQAPIRASSFAGTAPTSPACCTAWSALGKGVPTRSGSRAISSRSFQACTR